MTVLIDLSSSREWLSPDVNLPLWLNAEWLIEHDANLICALDHPDDVSVLRNKVAISSRLICYSGELLRSHLSSEDTLSLKRLFLDSLGASSYLQVKPNSATQPPAEPLPNISQNSAASPLHLALVTPLPPCPSGIATYCDEIIPALSEHYKITLVVENPDATDTHLTDHYEVISHAAFLQYGHQFDRIMYHFGNSSFHYDYFTLLKIHPGVVVLHDVYLGDCIYSNHKKMGETQLRQAIYKSHGWSALPDCEASPRQSIGIYPACGDIFSDAYGVIVHNQHAAELLSVYLDRDSQAQLTTTVLARKIKQLPQKVASRRALNIDEDATVYSSFGLFNRNKCFEEVMHAWVDSGLSQAKDAILVFAGGCNDKELEADVRAWRKRLPNPNQIVLTGYISNNNYDHYLAATDITIQLRKNSRGESSAALLDCMGAGLPTIVNRHGSMAEIPSNAVIDISDQFTIDELSRALRETKDDSAKRIEIGTQAQAYVTENHSPGAVAKAYRFCIEKDYQSAITVKTNALRKALFSSRARTLHPAELWKTLEQFDDIARCAQALRPSLLGKQILIDVSNHFSSADRDSHRSEFGAFISALLQRGDTRFRVEPIVFDEGSSRYRYARTYAESLLHLSPLRLFDDEVEGHTGDIYLSLAFDGIASNASPAQLDQLSLWRGRNIEIITLAHNPTSAGTPGEISTPLRQILELSSRIFCTSANLANSLKTLTKTPIIHLDILQELEKSPGPLHEADKNVLDVTSARPTFLMIGGLQSSVELTSVREAFLGDSAFKNDISLVHLHWQQSGEDVQSEVEIQEDSLYNVQTNSNKLVQALCNNASGLIVASSDASTIQVISLASATNTPILIHESLPLRMACREHAWYFTGDNSNTVRDELANFLEQFTREDHLPSHGLDWVRVWVDATNFLDSLLQEADSQK